MSRSQKERRPPRRLPAAGIIRRHPILSLLGVWAVLMVSGGVATTVLVHTDVSQQAPSAQAPGEQTAPASPSQPATASLLLQHPSGGNEELLPILSLGAIALSCTLGCWVLAQWLKASPSPNPTLHLSTSLSVDTAKPRSLPPSSPHGLAPHPAQDTSETPPAPTPITVLPTHQQHPLDWDEPSLADSLDLRHRRSLSSWL